MLAKFKNRFVAGLVAGLLAAGALYMAFGPIESAILDVTDYRVTTDPAEFAALNMRIRNAATDEGVIMTLDVEQLTRLEDGAQPPNDLRVRQAEELDPATTYYVREVSPGFEGPDADDRTVTTDPDLRLFPAVWFSAIFGLLVATATAYFVGAVKEPDLPVGHNYLER